MSTRTAVIAGGGPVGAVAAIMLARQGWTVQVCQLLVVSKSWSVSTELNDACNSAQVVLQSPVQRPTELQAA